MLTSNPKSTIADLSGLSGISIRTVERIIAELREEGIVKRIGSRKTGYWEVVE